MKPEFDIDFDLTSLDQAVTALENVRDTVPVQVLWTVSSYALSRVIQKTPVDTGLLRANWNPYGNTLSYVKTRPIVKNGNMLTLTIVNPTFYASWVEFGHRTVSGGFVPGQYFATNALAEAESSVAGKVETSVQKVLNETFYHLRGGKWDSARVLQYQ